MDLLNKVLENKNAAAELARVAGLDETRATKVVAKLLPAISGGVQNNIQKSGGLDALASALSKGGHQKYVDDPSALANATADGNGILGHLLGSKDVSRQVAAQVGAETGVEAGIVKQLLPMVAALTMGALSKETKGGEQLRGGAGDLLGSLLGGGGDNPLGAVAGLAKKFL